MMRIDQTKAIFPEIQKTETKTAQTDPTTIGSFSSDLQSAIDGVRNNLTTSDQQSANAIVGNGSPHDAMLSLAQAELSFRMMTQVRNKMLEAYREIMRMQL
jgi:flagellar hook-basal body complex protein FliE